MLDFPRPVSDSEQTMRDGLLPLAASWAYVDRAEGVSRETDVPDAFLGATRRPRIGALREEASRSGDTSL